MRIIFNTFFLIIIVSLLISCNNKESNEDGVDQKQLNIKESDVVGFYTGRGLYNARDATIELYYGGSFEMEDPYLPSGGSAFGKWVLRGNSIDFYMDGQKSFSANISKRVSTMRDVEEGTDKMKVGGIILKGQVWMKIR